MSLNMNIKEGNEEHHSLMDSTHRGMSANAAPETIELTVPESLKREVYLVIYTQYLTTTL